MSTNPPPTNLAAENVVLGTLISDDGYGYSEATSRGLDDSCFFHPASKVIWAALKAVRTKQGTGPIDPQSLILEMGNTPFEAIGGFDTFAEVATNSSLSNLKSFVNELLKLKIARKCLDLSARMLETFSDVENLDVDAALSVFEGEIMNATMDKSDVVLTTKQLAESTFNYIMDLHNAETKGLMFELEGIDRMICGLEPEKLVVIAARPGTGKSMLATHLYSVSGFKNHRGAFFSLEMSHQELLARVFSNMSQVNTRRVKEGLATKRELDALAAAKAKFGAMDGRFMLFDERRYSIDQIVSQCRRAHLVEKLDLVVIDYLQLISTTPQKNGSRDQAIGELTGKLKGLAKELKVPVVVLSQINRESVKAGKYPALHNLRESGSIEQDADIVILLANKIENGQDIDGVVHCDIAKHRGGPVGSCFLNFDKPMQTISDWEEYEY
jgi:replicative DNA helicase